MPLQRKLNANFTFENFKVSSENQLAFSSALCLAAGPGIEANPLFLYGPSGSGKTHLLNAIFNEYKKNYPNKKILNITAVHLGEWHFGEYFSGNEEEVENHLKSLDLLLVDGLDTIDDYYYQDEEPFPLTSTPEVIQLLRHPLEHNVKVVVASRKPMKYRFKDMIGKKGFEIQLNPVSLA